MEAKKSSIRKDLITIFVVIGLLLVVTGVLYAIDSSRDVIGTWAEQFYSFLLRR